MAIFHSKLTKLIFFIIFIYAAWVLIQSLFYTEKLDPYPLWYLMVSFIAGVMYVSVLTSPLSVGFLVLLGHAYNPWLVGLSAGLGAMAGDMLIVNSFKWLFGFSNSHFSIIRFIFKRLHKFLVKGRLQIFLPIFGAMIVASPFPDEVGLAMLGAGNLKTYQLAILTYLLNTTGILVITLTAHLIR